jgi:acyl-coenzyme A synthetase/AMP-(fatty) acid ligase
VFLLNDDLTETVDGEIGEICVSGPILALGYYNDPERSDESFVINPNYKGYPERMYRTGDYGRIREDGLLEFHGRMDRQIKHMGHRVELDEVEYAVSRVDGVAECSTLYSKEKETIYLFYAGSVDTRTLVLEIRKVLPGFMVPRKVKKLESLPKLANGKIDMNKLKEIM